MKENKNTSNPNLDLLLSHLIAVWFLTYRIPNREVYSTIFSKFKTNLIKKYNLHLFYGFKLPYLTAYLHLFHIFGKSVKETVCKNLGVFFTTATKEGGKFVGKKFGESKFLHPTKG